MTTSVNAIITAHNAKQQALGQAAVTTDAAKRGVYALWEAEGKVNVPGRVGLVDKKDIEIVVQRTSPVDNSVSTGNPATFRTTTVNSIPTDTFTYQWYYVNGTAIVANSIYTGVTASNLVISDATGLNGRRFYCVVSAATYGGSAQTAVANLAVS
jgi:hypothetical protein